MAQAAQEPTPTPDREDRTWIRGFAVVLVCQFLVFGSFSSVMPFIPLYLRELGESQNSAIAWAGATQTVGAVILLVITPVWGALSDRVGRKLMVLRSLVGGAAAVVGMALATQAWHLLIMRVIQGLTAGSNSAIIALASSILPPARLGMGMGVLQTVQFLGNSLGPALGGLGSATVGFRGTFMIAAASLIVIAVAMGLFVREPLSAESRSGPSVTLKARLALVGRVPRLRPPLLAILGFQAAWQVSIAFLPLHVALLVPTEAEAAATAGILLTSTALGVAVGASFFGWLSGRVGERPVALFALSSTSLLLIPQTWMTDPVQFALLRGALGFCAGGVLPSLRASLGRYASNDPSLSGSLGAVYGFAQSAFTGGMVVGPSLGAVVGLSLGLPQTHLASGAILMLTALVYWRSTR